MELRPGGDPRAAKLHDQRHADHRLGGGQEGVQGRTRQVGMPKPVDVKKFLTNLHNNRFPLLFQGGLQGPDGRDRLQQAGGGTEAPSHGAALAEAHALHHRRVGRDQARLQVNKHHVNYSNCRHSSTF